MNRVKVMGEVRMVMKKCNLMEVFTMKLWMIITATALIILVFITKKKKITIFSGKEEITQDHDCGVISKDDEIRHSFVPGKSVLFFTSFKIVYVKKRKEYFNDPLLFYIRLRDRRVCSLALYSRA